MGGPGEASRDRPWRLAWKRRSGLKRLIVGTGIVLLLPVVAFQLGKRAETTAEAVANAAPPPTRDVTAAVEFRALDQGEVFRGTIRVDKISVLASDSGVVVEALAANGGVVDEGHALAVIDDRPLILLLGDLPLVGDLLPEATGSWVLQLQESLSRLGFYELEVDGEFGPGTQRAVRQLYVSLGFSPPSGADFGRDSEGNPPAAGRSSSTPLPVGEVVFLPSLPARVVNVYIERGDVVSAGQPLLDLAPGEVIVEVKIASVDVARFDSGDSVTIQLEDDELEGSVSTVAEATSETGRSDWIVTITPSAPLPTELDGTSLRVVVGASSLDEPQLVVPASAISFDAEGATYVALQMPSGEFQNVLVTTGLETGGFVAVTTSTAGQLAEGDRVRVGFPNQLEGGS